MSVPDAVERLYDWLAAILAKLTGGTKRETPPEITRLDDYLAAILERTPASSGSALDFTLTSNLTQNLYLTQSAASAVTVDWGDGSASETPAELSASLTHTYPAAGDYTVRITCEDGETWSPGCTIGNTTYGLCGRGGKSDTYPTLTNVTFGSGMRLDAKSAFDGCTNLASITISSDITTIAESAFRGCTSLLALTIPASVSTINMAFIADCTNLAELTVLNPTPPSSNNAAFLFQSAPEALDIFVLASAVEAYKAAAGFSSRAADIQAIST